MVFSSVPVYLDPPNWNQHQQQQQQAHHGQLQSGGGGGGGGGGNGGGVEAHAHAHHHHQQHHHHQLPPMPPPGALMAPRPDMALVVAASGGAGSGGAGGGGPTGGSAVRPGSMTERARLAKIPQPEPGLKCPRCESTNTKFCYFNNYSLSQPRHFCKTCRRYWTRGGALRNVPVGGGCRRNKRTKSSKSNSSSAASASAAGGGTSSSTSSTATGGTNAAAAAAAIMSPQGQLPFLASLHHPLGVGGDHYSTGASRLGFPGLSSMDPVDYQLGAGATALGLEQWRLSPMQHQFPFLSRPDGVPPPPMSGIYPFDVEGHGDAGGGFAGQMLSGGSKVPGSAGLITQLASVKMEDNNPASTAMTNSPREFLGLSGNLQFWGGAGNGASGNNGGTGTANAGGGGGGGGAAAPGSSWVDLSGFNSSSSGNIL